jgi:hypothetical protein
MPDDLREEIGAALGQKLGIFLKPFARRATTVLFPLPPFPQTTIFFILILPFV